MKKNNGKLIVALVSLVVLLVFNLIMGPKLSTIMIPGGSLTESYQVVFKQSENDRIKVKQSVEVFKKRLELLGATIIDVNTNVKDTITITFENLQNAKEMCETITQPGVITFRDSKDNVLADRSDLQEVAIDVKAYDETSSYFNFHIVENSRFAKIFVDFMFDANSDKMLVGWVDYDESTSYEAESKKSSPAYLVAAQVSNPIAEDFYIVCDKPIADAKVMAVLVNGGELNAEVKVESFTTLGCVYGEQVTNKLVLSIFVLVALIIIGLVLRYNLMGAVSGLMCLTYTVGSLMSISYLKVAFSLATLALFMLGLMVNLGVCVTIDETFAKEALNGLLGKAALNEKVGKLNKQVFAGYTLAFISASIFYLLTSKNESGVAVCALTYVVAGFVLFALWNELMIVDLAESKYFTNKNFMVKEKKNLSLAKSLNTKTAYLVATIILVLVAIIAFIKGHYELKTLMVVLTSYVLTMITCYLYSSLTKDVKMMKVLVPFALTGLSFSVVMTLSSSIMQGVVFVSLTIIVLMLTLSKLNSGYVIIAKGKLTDEKVCDFANNTADELASNLLLSNGLLIVLATIIMVVIFAFDVNTLILVVFETASIVYMGIYLPTYLWGVETNKIAHTPKRKKKVKRTTELREKTIVGINEIR